MNPNKGPMKTRWMIPGAVALSLHALILLGFRSAPRPAVPHDCPLPPVTPATQRITLAEPPEVQDGESSTPAGGPAVPRSEEPVVAPRMDHPGFTMVPAAVTPGRSRPITSFPPACRARAKAHRRAPE